MGTTANYHWTKPTVSGDADTWGTELNATLDAIDAKVKQVDDSVPDTVTAPVLLAHGNVTTGGAAFLSLDLSGYTAYKRLSIKLNRVNPSLAATGAALQVSIDGRTTWVNSGYGWSLATLGSAYSFASDVSSSDDTRIQIQSAQGILHGSIDFSIFGGGGLTLNSNISGNQGSSHFLCIGAGSNPITGINGLRLYGLGAAVVSAGSYDLIGYL